MKSLKYIFITLIAVALGITLLSANRSHLLQFAENSFDFGTISDDHAPVVHEYKFVNTADEPVAILSVTTGCGCTRPEYPVKPIAAGDSGHVKITFLPTGQKGNINKDITVRYRSATAKSSKRLTLRLRGTVVKNK